MATRAEHRRDTLLRLGEAAVDLFEADGPAATIEAIADRAGMSRRTVIRYVGAKAELAFVHPMLWIDVFDNAFAAASELEPVERIRHASLAIAAHVDGDPDPVRRAFTVAASHPDLLSGFQAVYGAWVDHLSGVVGDLAPTDIPFEARILGGAIMGMVDAVTRDWLLSGVSYSDALDRGFAVIEPLLAEHLG